MEVPSDFDTEAVARYYQLHLPGECEECFRFGPRCTFSDECMFYCSQHMAVHQKAHHCQRKRRLTRSKGSPVKISKTQ